MKNGTGMTVRELIGGEVVWIDQADSMRQAVQLMVGSDIGALAVEFDGRIEGIITERDVLGACNDDLDLDATPVSRCMTSSPDTLEPDMSVDDAADWLLAAGYRHLPVVDEGQILGMVSIKDILWALAAPTRA
jgi:CBS domain-containing protein